MSRSNKKELNTDVDLLPFIAVLAVCISFLLLTVVWINVGSFNLSQALGTEAISEQSQKNPSLWIHFESDGHLSLSVKNPSPKSKKHELSVVRGSSNNRANLSEARRLIEKIKKSEPNINIALILPAANSPYQDVVSVMDVLRQNKISEIGIAPL